MWVLILLISTSPQLRPVIQTVDFTSERSCLAAAKAAEVKFKTPQGIAVALCAAR